MTIVAVTKRIIMNGKTANTYYLITNLLV